MEVHSTEGDPSPTHGSLHDRKEQCALATTVCHCAGKQQGDASAECHHAQTPKPPHPRLPHSHAPRPKDGPTTREAPLYITSERVRTSCRPAPMRHARSQTPHASPRRRRTPRRQPQRTPRRQPKQPPRVPNPTRREPDTPEPERREPSTPDPQRREPDTPDPERREPGTTPGPSSTTL